MTSPAGGSKITGPEEAVRALALQVNRDTVLKARAALLAESQRLDTELDRKYKAFQGVGLCGRDPVSPEAAAAFNERIDALVQSCFDYNRRLAAAARTLDATAREYGYTDEEIAQSFQPG